MTAMQEFADVLPGLAQRHDRIRDVNWALNDEILGEMDPDTFWQAAEMLGIAPSKEVVTGGVIGAGLVPEFSMYGVFADGENVVQRFRRTHPQTDPERQMILDAMSQANFTMVGVVETYPAEHALLVGDLFQDNRRMLLADDVFAADTPAGEAMWIRVYPIGKFWMSTSLGMPLGVNMDFPPLLDFVSSSISSGIWQDPGSYEIRNGFYAAMAMKKLLSRYQKDSGTSGKIPDEPPEEHHNEHLQSERIERNAPCPCGSGKKYKKCCGR